MTRPSLAPDASPEAFAEASIHCQGYFPACSDANECRQGDCFKPNGIGYKGAHKALTDLRDADKNPYSRAWLSMALAAIEHYRAVELG